MNDGARLSLIYNFISVKPNTIINFVSMIDVSPIYAYLGTLKEEPKGDFAAYKGRVKTSEIGFRSALTQIALELEQEGRMILFLRDFNDLSTTLKEGIRFTNKADKAKVEWLAFEEAKSKEAADYIKRVQADLSNGEKVAPMALPNNEAASVKVISGTEGLAKYIGSGKTKAFQIIKSGVLKRAGIQYKVGNCWKFNAEKLTKYLADNPEFLK